MRHFNVPKDFVPPVTLKTQKVLLRCLTIHDTVKDYDAVMTSMDHLEQARPFGPTSKWPSKELTLEQNFITLGWHQKEFQR